MPTVFFCLLEAFASIVCSQVSKIRSHADVIRWKHFPRYWPFVRGHRRIPRTKASDAELWCISLICAWITDWVNNGEAGDLINHRAPYDVTVMVAGIENEHNSTSSWAYDLFVIPVNTILSISYSCSYIAFIYHCPVLSGPADPLPKFHSKRPLTTRNNIDFPRY